MQNINSSSLEFLMTKLEAYVKAETKNRKDLLESLTLAVYSESSEQSDLYLLAKVFNTNELVKLVRNFPGKTITVPTNTEFLHNFLVVIVYILYKIEKLPKKFIISKLRTAENLSDVNLRHVFRKVNSMQKNMAGILLKFSESININDALDKFDMYAKSLKKNGNSQNNE